MRQNNGTVDRKTANLERKLIMARIASVGKSELYAEHLTQGCALNERNDCAVRAVAAATGRPYDEVHALFKAEGRRDGGRTFCNITWAVLKQLGLKAEIRNPRDMISQYPGNHARVLKSVTTHHPDRFNKVWADGKTYLLFTPGHILAVVNGVNHDWTRGRAMRVTRMYEVVPA